MSHVDFGRSGESAACAYLQSIGYEILVQNFRCKLGEIDIIAKDKAMHVFIEVKTRYSSQHGQPFEAVTYHKQRQLKRLAQVYLKFTFGTVDILSRFDVISILYKNGKPELRHIKNAIYFM